ncbi:MAG: 4-(cytidine 5'-diphospho)-2-C-methyl-D-erythritol kinase [Lachnospiraceae bacterium]|nr:4-(cytidine 5'-diphospho)-2-C-methyl-D-erythritol kinase [Lachnospiraceae bacterium]
MNHISTKSYAKINLGLDVLGTLPNGYHELKMIMQTITLNDNLFFEKRKDNRIILKTNLPFLPVNEKNIVYQAVKLFMETMHISSGIYCTVTKHIPVAAGMAGGSGNAAAALKAMDALFGTKLSADELASLGVKLGADVPYCLMGNTALAEGIGDVLTPLPAPPKAKVLIVKPMVSVSTKEVYTNLVLDENTKHPDIDACISALHSGSLKDLCDNLGNVLEDVTVKLHPCIAEIKSKMIELGADGSLMSGSGPSVFGLYSDEEKADDAYKYFKATSEYGRNTFLCDFT